MTIPLTLLLVFTYVPFLEMFKFSLYDRTYLKVKDFVGLENYIEVFTRDDLFATLKLSLFYIAGGFVQLALALFFATILCFKTKGSALFKGFLFFPYLINGMPSALFLSFSSQEALCLIQCSDGLDLIWKICHIGLKI